MSSLHETLLFALQHQADLMLSQQKYDEATALYERLLALNPRLAAGQFNLGNAWMARNEWLKAIACYQAAIRLVPNLVVAHTNLGHALRSARQLTEATISYRRAASLEPQNAIAISNLANVLSEQGQLDEAIELYRKTLSLKPDHFETYNNLGNVLCRHGKSDEAIGIFDRALQLSPDNPSTLCNLGVALRNENRLDEAIACYCKAIELKPNCADAFCNLGEVLKCQDDIDQAMVCFIKALEFNPDHFESLSNLVELFGLQRNLEEAVRCYGQALVLKPDSADLNIRLGNAFKDHGQLDRAVTYYHQALEHDPSFAAAWCNLGVAMQNQGRTEEAIAYFRRAMQSSPKNTVVHNNLLYSLQYRDDISLAELADAHREFELQHTAPLCPTISPRCVGTSHHRPLRLGFVSADFGRHPVGYFMEGVLKHLSRDEFETVCFSDRARVDEVTWRLQSAATEWHHVRQLDHERLACKIQSERIDILFDLAGHTSENRLLTFARKPAPIQITWAGYVGTTGLKQMDYILADRFEIPVGAERYYQEAVLRMPDGYVCYTPPVVTPEVTPLPALRNGHITFGCFNNPAKLTSRITDAWAKILQRLPDSQLILKYKAWNDKNVASRFVERFARQIDPSRIKCLCQSSHLELLAEYNHVDIALDSFPYSGGLTTCEALWMGVPVVTCPAETFASRHSFSHLSNIGLTETIARDLDDYVDRTILLANNLSHLAELRSNLRERMAASPLCDSKRFAANLGKLLREVWNERCTHSIRAAA